MPLGGLRIAAIALYVPAIVFAIIELGLTAYEVNELDTTPGADLLPTQFPATKELLFASVWTFIVVAIGGFTVMLNTSIPAAIASFTAFAFWLGGGIAQAVWIAQDVFCNDEIGCFSLEDTGEKPRYEAIAAFAFLEAIVFIGILALDVVGIFKK